MFGDRREQFKGGKACARQYIQPLARHGKFPDVVLTRVGQREAQQVTVGRQVIHVYDAVALPKALRVITPRDAGVHKQQIP